MDPATITAMMPTGNASPINVNLAFTIHAGGGDDLGERIVKAIRDNLESSDFHKAVVHVVHKARFKNKTIVSLQKGC